MTNSRYADERIEPYTIEPCRSLQEHAQREAARHAGLSLPRKTFLCPVSGLETCCQVQDLGTRVADGGFQVVAPHVPQAEAERLREERLVLVCREVCAGCGRVFDGRQVPDGHPIGWYGQYCSGVCRDGKEQEMKDVALTNSVPGQVVLILDAPDRYCYVVTNNGPRDPEHRHYHYNFKLLIETQEAEDSDLSLSYCFLDRSIASIVPLRLAPLMRVALARYDSYANSLSAIVGATIEEGVVSVFGVGGPPIIIDLRTM